MRARPKSLAVRLSMRMNWLVDLVLRSRLHWLLSSGLTLITVTGRRTGQRYTIPVGYLETPDAVVVLVGWRERNIEIVRGEPLPSSNEFGLALTNVAAVTVEGRSRRIDTDVNGSIDVTSDGLGSVTLVGLRSGQPVRRFGTVFAGRDGRAVIELSAGQTVLVLVGLPVP